MRLTSLLILSALSSLNHIAHAFPLKPQAPPKQPAVRRRVAYSVVAVDGGGSAVTPSAAPVPDTITLLQTSDSIETVTAPARSTPPSIETITATKIVSELEPAKTMDIIITQDVTNVPSPTIISSYIAVNSAETPTSSLTSLLTSQTFTCVPSMKRATSFSTSTLPLSSTTTSISIPTTSMPMASSNWGSEAAHPAEAIHPEAKGPEAAASIPSPPSRPPLRPSPAITISSALPTASTKTYDDGMWHTSYPVWNATSTVLSIASARAVGIARAKNFWNKG